ncbi:MAG: hypothetical protein LBT75_03705 [Bacilli bacterium]|jgi:flavodoxin|nr:hypothetical protein [Bacilli bacterium]
MNKTIAIRYYSKTGHTKKLAKVLSDYFNIEALTINEPLTTPTDLLFLGGACYGATLSKEMMAFIKTLNPQVINNIIIFTSACKLNPYQLFVEELQKNNLNVAKEYFYCKGSFLIMNINHPNQDDLVELKKFASKISNTLLKD